MKAKSTVVPLKEERVGDRPMSSPQAPEASISLLFWVLLVGGPYLIVERGVRDAEYPKMVRPQSQGTVDLPLLFPVLVSNGLTSL